MTAIPATATPASCSPARARCEGGRRRGLAPALGFGLGLGLLAALAAPGRAAAGPVGIVVRLDATGGLVTAPVVAQLKGSAEKPFAIQLNDSGDKPDVTAGDGQWAGHGLIDVDEVTYSVEVAGRTLEGAAVSWEAGDGPKDLDIVLTGTTLSATPSRRAAQGQGLASDLGPSATAPPLGGGATAAGGPNAIAPATSGAFTTASTASPRPRSASFPVESGSGSATLFIAFGAGLLVLVGVLWAWSRRGARSEAADGPPPNLTLLPEPALFGPGSPSLSDGLSLWVATPDEVSEALRPLLARLADGRRVLVVAPSGTAVPAVHGGPVYRLNAARPPQIALAVESLLREGGLPVSVLVASAVEDEATLRELADSLPAEVGGVVLGAVDLSAPLPRYRLGRTGAGLWSLEGAAGTGALRLVEGPSGLVRRPAP